jgi:hypothetical protein
LRIERGENIAQMIMRGRAIAMARIWELQSSCGDELWLRLSRN